MNPGNYKKIFNIQLTSLSIRQIPEYIESLVKKKGKKTFFYVNAHCINLTDKDSEYKAILQKASLVYSGGIGPI